MSELPRGWKYSLAALPIAGGAALTFHVLADVSLPLAAGSLVLFGSTAWAAILFRSTAEQRRIAIRRVAFGMVAGTAGVIAYDASRYGLVALFAMSFQPFHVFTVFGRLFLGEAASTSAAIAAGVLYHLMNGIGFAVAFAIIVRRPSWIAGAIWGIALELAMAFLYPSWLRMAALGEFLTVSAIGHVIYGSVMGFVLERLLRKPSH